MLVQVTRSRLLLMCVREDGASGIREDLYNPSSFRSQRFKIWFDANCASTNVMALAMMMTMRMMIVVAGITNFLQCRRYVKVETRGRECFSIFWYTSL